MSQAKVQCLNAQADEGWPGTINDTM